MAFRSGSEKSPFTERGKATKSHLSHLSPRRSTTSEVGNSRGVQHSLFGKESQLGNTGGKASQWRTAQAEVKEPTTPTKASEGALSGKKRREDFSTFSRGRVVTPIRTMKPAFGTTPPRSPKRPYLGSPKYQKVLLERPAFYNSPSGGPTTGSGKKEVSISELQQRLKRFLQEESNPSQSLEVPFTISSSPRVNPLFHHDNTVLQVAKGGIAFTAGMEVGTGTDDSAMPSKEDADESARLQMMASLEDAEQLRSSFSDGEIGSIADVSDDGGSKSLEMLQPLSPVDFPVHSEVVDIIQTEDVGTGHEEPSAAVPSQAATNEELSLELDQDGSEVTSSSTLDQEVLESVLSGEIVELTSSSDTALKEETVQDTDLGVETRKTMGLQLEEEEQSSSSEEEEIEEIEISQSWPEKILKFVVLAVMVACVMGVMVLTSGSRGLLSESLHFKPVAKTHRDSSLSTSFLPISIGFLGLGKDYEGLPCEPAVHLGLEFLSSSSKVDSRQFEGSAPSYLNGYESLSPARRNSGLEEISVVDVDQLKTVTDQFKHLQGMLFSDVAGLTSEFTITDSSNIDLSEDNGLSMAVEDVSEFVNEATEEHQLETSSRSEEFGTEVATGFPVPQDPESLPTSLASTVELETDRLPTDEELDALNLVVGIPGEEAVQTADFLSVETEEHMSTAYSNSELDMGPVNLNLWETEDVLFGEPASYNTLTILAMDASTLDDQVCIIEEAITPGYPVATPVQVAHETSDLGGVATVMDHEEGVMGTFYEEAQPKSTADTLGLDVAAAEMTSGATSEAPLKQIDVTEEPALDQEKKSLLIDPRVSIGLLVAVSAFTVLFFLKARGGATASGIGSFPSTNQTAAAYGHNSLPNTETMFKILGSPVAWPTAHSVHDSHMPEKEDMGVITSPLTRIKTQRKNVMEDYSTKFRNVIPAFSVPGPHHQSSAEEKSGVTWHPVMRATNSSSYRQTASYIPSYSGISTGRGVSEMDSAVESALTMGAEEWEHLGSYTTNELVSVSEGGEERKKLTPVRRSQRIRNKVSPIPMKFSDYAL